MFLGPGTLTTCWSASPFLYVHVCMYVTCSIWYWQPTLNVVGTFILASIGLMLPLAHTKLCNSKQQQHPSRSVNIQENPSHLRKVYYRVHTSPSTSRPRVTPNNMPISYSESFQPHTEPLTKRHAHRQLKS
jgi:hypothetical protein